MWYRRRPGRLELRTDEAGTFVFSPPVSPEGRHSAAAALLILVPLAIALQVVVRLPRDPEGVDADEAVAHRQFWGNVARISTMAAAFVAASTAIGNLLFSLQLPLIDVVELLGVPAGATIAMVLASDAAAVADQQAERLRLAAHRVAVYRGRLERAMRRLDETAYASDSETSRKSRGRRAARSMLARAALGITTSVGVGAWVTAVHFGHTGLTLAYVLIATILGVFVTWVAIDVAVHAAMDQLLDAVMTVSPAAMIVVVFSLTGATSAMTIGGGDDCTRYLAGLAFGFLLGFPSLWVIGLLLVRVGPGRRKPPLRAVAWARLDARLARTRMKSGPEREPWRSFAIAAILLSPIPPAGWAFSMMALWRRGPSQNGKRLLFWSWAVTVSLAGVEIAALISLPLWL